MKRVGLTLLFLGILTAQLAAQTVFGDSIIIEGKKGTLGKVLGKWNYPGVKKLKMIGEVGEMDIKALQSALYYITSFTTIDLSETEYIGGKFYNLSKEDLYTECKLGIPSSTKVLKMFKYARKGKKPVALLLTLSGSIEGSLYLFVSGRSGLELNFGDLGQTSSILKLQLYKENDKTNPIYFMNKKNIVDVLEIPNSSSYYQRIINKFSYSILRIMENDEVYIQKWNKNYGKEYLESVKELNELIHFKNLSGTISLPKVKKLPNFCFMESPGLREVILENVEEIDYCAFQKTSVHSLVLPSTIKKLHRDAFSGNIRTVEFLGTTPPHLNAKNDEDWIYKDICFIVPKGSLQNYKTGIWGKLKVREKGFNPDVTINCTQPGTFSSYLTPEVINNTDNLVVTGTVYDTEKDLVKKIKWLKNVDWSGVTVVKSPETIAAEKKAEQERQQWEKDRPKREAAAKKLKERREKFGSGTTSEGYAIGYNDGYRGVNNYLTYELSERPLYSDAFLMGYIQGFEAGSNERSKETLRQMRR